MPLPLKDSNRRKGEETKTASDNPHHAPLLLVPITPPDTTLSVAVSARKPAVPDAPDKGAMNSDPLLLGHSIQLTREYGE